MSLSESKLFTCAAILPFLSHRCCSYCTGFCTGVGLVLPSSHLYHTHFARMELKSHYCCTSVARVARKNKAKSYSQNKYKMTC